MAKRRVDLQGGWRSAGGWAQSIGRAAADEDAWALGVPVVTTVNLLHYIPRAILWRRSPRRRTLAGAGRASTGCN